MYKQAKKQENSVYVCTSPLVKAANSFVIKRRLGILEEAVFLAAYRIEIYHHLRFAIYDRWYRGVPVHACSLS